VWLPAKCASEGSQQAFVMFSFASSTFCEVSCVVMSVTLLCSVTRFNVPVMTVRFSNSRGDKMAVTLHNSGGTKRTAFLDGSRGLDVFPLGESSIQRFAHFGFDPFSSSWQLSHCGLDLLSMRSSAYYFFSPCELLPSGLKLCRGNSCSLHSNLRFARLNRNLLSNISRNSRDGHKIQVGHIYLDVSLILYDLKSRGNREISQRYIFNHSPFLNTSSWKCCRSSHWKLVAILLPARKS